MERFIFFCSSMEGSLSYIHLTMSEDPCPILSQHIKYAFGNDKNDFAEYVHPWILELMFRGPLDRLIDELLICNCNILKTFVPVIIGGKNTLVPVIIGEW